MFKRTVFAAALLASAMLPSVGSASAEDIATRIFNIETQVRNLTGQIEELNHSMQLLQKQIAAGAGQSGALEPAVLPKLNLKKLAEAPAAEQGVETIVDTPEPVIAKRKVIIAGAENTDQFNADSNDLAATDASAGQVLVPEEALASAATPAVTADATTGDGIENVSLTPSADTPEAIYERWYEALLRRQFPEAEAGFRDFLSKYPEHSLAGSAQYQLGETFYAQANYQEAARNFLQGYKNYPKSRRAPDSLLKLGMSLKKMGQKDQACAALGSVGSEFPRAVEAKKRATAEFNRGGC